MANKSKHCDFCGNEFTGKNYPELDEQFKVIKGSYRCVDCMREHYNLLEDGE